MVKNQRFVDESRDLSAIRDWVFDLDNTLYPPDGRIFDQVDKRMGEFLGRQFGLDPAAARELQKRYYRTYGTTLRGLMLHHPEVDPHAYLDYVHDIDLSLVSPAPALDAALARLPGRKLVFTNGSLRHAEAVLERLGIARRFDAIFDVAAAEFVPKPEPACYHGLLAAHAVQPTRAALFEDTAINLPPAAALGMTTVLVVPPRAPTADVASAVPLPSPEGPIHYVTDDLAAWLDRAIARRQRA